jgi:hypothetical protein
VIDVPLRPRVIVLVFLLGPALASSLFPRVASAQPKGALSAREHVVSARRDGHYAFCSDPKRPFSQKHSELCPLAAEIEGCEGFKAACERDARESEERRAAGKKRATRDGVMAILGELAKFLVWLLVALVIGAVAFPIIRALLRGRRDKALADAPAARNVSIALTRPPPPEAEGIVDAEAALREADERARRGELARALSLYLAASLAALDHRGAIRLARHRTNGEYVRSCADADARTPLREIVREVDKVEFGKLLPTSEGVAHVAARANALVRATGSAGAAGRARGAASIATSALFTVGTLVLIVLAPAVGGCGGSRSQRSSGPNDPSGDELPMEVLRRSGYQVSYLSTPLSELPMPSVKTPAPLVIVDVERVLLEEESSAHLVRWVNEGGVLVLFGPPGLWPPDLHAQTALATSHDLDVLDGYVRGARVATPRAMLWPASEPIGRLDKDVYAAHKRSGKGLVIGIAGDDLVTNIGVSRPDNAAAFVALIDAAFVDRDDGSAEDTLEPRRATASSSEVKVARREDGIPPPSNPFSALVQAGLGKGAWHALAAAVVLFLAFGIRHARARPAAPPARRAFAEHVEATGAFYGRARAVGHALASYGRFAEMRVRERVPRGADPVHFLATRANVAPEDVARIWKRAIEAKPDDPPRGDELRVIRDLRAMLAKAFETG